MRILVLGADGYLGWPTALHLSDAGHEVGVLDNFARRGYDEEMGVAEPGPDRVAARPGSRPGRRSPARASTPYVGDLCDAEFTTATLRDFAPDAIVHFAEQRSAPYSMIDRAHAVYTQRNNVVGNLNLLYAIAEIDPRHPPGQARHDGRVRHAQHRHRGGLARGRAQRAQRPDALPEEAGLLLPPVQGARQPQHRVHLPDLGAARHRPEPGRRVRPADPGRPRATRGWPPGSTTTPSSAPCSTASSSRPCSATR